MTLSEKFENYHSVEQIETVNLINDSNLITLLVFIAENKQSKELMNFNKDEVKNLALKIIDDSHYVPFYQCINKVQNFEHSDMENYICDNHNHYLAEWVIEKVFWSDFQKQIDQILGSQDITSLFFDILSHGNGKIDGIDEEVYGLRETCEQCQHIDFDSDDVELECNCVGLNEVNNVWLISSATFYQFLKSDGAMVYETDSLYLYFQTTYAGTHYDKRLRQAWLKYTWLGCLL